jgi:hypothetical protein
MWAEAVADVQVIEEDERQARPTQNRATTRNTNSTP